MKSFILILFSLCPFLLFSQTSGEITFKETIKFEIELPEGMEAFKDQIPSSQSFQRVLLFNDAACIYKDIIVEKEEASSSSNFDGGGVQMQVEFANADDQMYQNLESGETLEKREFMGKRFLIEGEAKRYKWKMTGEQKTVLDYNCQKAVYQDTSGTIIAWFSTQIPVSSGPLSYSGLPGMILEMDINDGQQTVVATAISLKSLEKDAIVKPKKGKNISAAAFEKIVAEKTKEMQEEFGGSGNVVIKIGGN